MSTFKDTLKQSTNVSRNPRPTGQSVKSKSLLNNTVTQNNVTRSDNKLNVITPTYYVYNVVMNLLKDFAILDEGFLKLNNNLYDTDAVLDSEREVSFDVMAYLADNLGVLCAAMAMDYRHCRDAIAAELEYEMSMNEMTAQEHIVARNKVLVKDDPIPFTYSMHIGITTFSETLIVELLNKISDSFTRVDRSPNADVINKAVESLSNEDKLIIGMIVSNYMYFVRGCNHNAKFLATVTQTIELFKADYAI